MQRWEQIRDLHDSELEDQLKVWDRAVERLTGLAEQLEAMGYNRCLYRLEKPEYACLVCGVKPFNKETCPSWELL